MSGILNLQTLPRVSNPVEPSISISSCDSSSCN
jgi:hypothetical protein